MVGSNVALELFSPSSSSNRLSALPCCCFRTCYLKRVTNWIATANTCRVQEHCDQSCLGPGMLLWDCSFRIMMGPVGVQALQVTGAVLSGHPDQGARCSVINALSEALKQQAPAFWPHADVAVQLLLDATCDSCREVCRPGSQTGCVNWTASSCACTCCKLLSDKDFPNQMHRHHCPA